MLCFLLLPRQLSETSTNKNPPAKVCVIVDIDMQGYRGKRRKEDRAEGDGTGDLLW